MTALSIMQAAAIQVGLAQPSNAAASDANTKLLLRLLNQEGDELSRRWDWQNLIVQQSFTSTATEAQADALPSDYDRILRNTVIWNQTKNLPYNGPTGSRAWLALKTANISGAAIGWWRIIGNALHIFPTPAAGDTIAFEYISRNWCQSSGAVGQSAFAASADTALIPERLLTLGLVWRWKAAKGFAYDQDKMLADDAFERASADDKGTAPICLPHQDYAPQIPTFVGRIDAS